MGQVIVADDGHGKPKRVLRDRAAAPHSAPGVCAGTSPCRCHAAIGARAVSWRAPERRGVGCEDGMVVYDRCGPRGDRRTPPGYFGTRSDAGGHVPTWSPTRGGSNTPPGRDLEARITEGAVTIASSVTRTSSGPATSIEHRAYSRPRAGRSPIGRVVLRQGFTLLEVAIVLVVCAIISAIALPSFFGAVGADADLTVNSDVQRLQFETRAYYDAHNAFPQTPGNGWTTALVGGLDFRPSPGMQFALQRSSDAQSVYAVVGPVAPPLRYCYRAMGGYDTGIGIECVGY